MADVNLQLTAAGQALYAKIQQGLGTIPLNITRIVTASGRSDDPLNLTDVVDEQQTLNIVNRTVVGTRAIIEAYLTNYGNPDADPVIPPLAQGYLLSQIGFFAIDPDVGEILFIITQFDKPNWVPALSERGWEFTPTFNFNIGNASDVTIEINPSGFATMGQLNAHIDATVYSDGGVHGIRYTGGVLQVFDGFSWISITASGDIATHNTDPNAHYARFAQLQAEINLIMYLLQQAQPTGAFLGAGMFLGSTAFMV